MEKPRAAIALGVTRPTIVDARTYTFRVATVNMVVFVVVEGDFFMRLLRLRNSHENIESSTVVVQN